MEKDFNKNTISCNLFCIQDVCNDNACLYRAVANDLYFGSPYKSINHIVSMKKWGLHKKIEDVCNDYGNYSKKQDKLSRIIQSKILTFVKKNMTKLVPVLGNLTLKECIEMIHDISVEDYIEFYQTFAGDILTNESNNTCNEFYIDRWGSVLEQWIISEMLNIPIIIFNSQKWDFKLNKIVNGKIINNKPNKDVRLRIIGILGKKYLNDKLPIFLIWRNHNKNGHYLSLYPKNITNIKNMMIEFFQNTN
tara:strand:+ start:135 stop:881 length:747 start_codon:yes stop_codon:yes gene_type:complete